MSKKVYTHDKAADFFSRLEAREDVVTEAMQAVQAEYKKAAKAIGNTFEQDGQWYQIRNRGGKHYMVELPSAPAVYLKGPYTKRPRPEDITEVEDLAPDAGRQVEMDLLVGDDLVDFNEEITLLEDKEEYEHPNFLEPTPANPVMRVLGD